MPSLYECTFVCAVAAADIEDALGQALGDSGEIEHPGEDIKLRCSPTRRPQPLARGQVAVGCILTRGVHRHRESLPQTSVGWEAFFAGVRAPQRGLFPVGMTWGNGHEFDACPVGIRHEENAFRLGVGSVVASLLKDHAANGFQFQCSGFNIVDDEGQMGEP